MQMSCPSGAAGILQPGKPAASRVCMARAHLPRIDMRLQSEEVSDVYRNGAGLPAVYRCPPALGTTRYSCRKRLLSRYRHQRRATRRCSARSAPVTQLGRAMRPECPEPLRMCLVAAPIDEVAARNRGAGFFRQGVVGQSLCRLKSAFLSNDLGERPWPDDFCGRRRVPLLSWTLNAAR